jgi:hypothetical protein
MTAGPGWTIAAAPCGTLLGPSCIQECAVDQDKHDLMRSKSKKEHVPARTMMWLRGMREERPV